MIPVRETVAVLLCAGLSQRYGEGNKLLAPLEGRPLVAHAAGVLAGLPFRERIEVTGSDVMTLPGFRSVSNPAPERGQDSSVRIGLAAALEAKPRGVLICLGDMPFVTAAHLEALAEAATDEQGAISSSGEWRSPPLLLPADLAKQVLAKPEAPVRKLIAEAAEVPAPPAMLRDFDTPEDFAR